MPNKGFSKWLMLLGFSLLTSTALSAELTDNNTLDGLFSLSLEEVLALRMRVSVASTKPETITQTPAIVSTLNRQQMEKLGLTTLTDVLSFIPGFIMGKTHEGTAAVMIRGVSVKALLLLDGVPYREPGNNNQPFAGIAFQSIERIEAIRGPGAVIYGSNATAGVINIITRQDEGSQVAIEVGPHESFNKQLYYNHALTQGGQISISAHHHKSLGFKARHSNTGTPAPQDRSYRTQTQNQSLYLKYQLSDFNFSIHNFNYQTHAIDPTFITGVSGLFPPDLYPSTFRERATLVHSDYQWQTAKTQVKIYSHYNRYDTDVTTLVLNTRLKGQYDQGGDNNYRWVGGGRLENTLSPHLTLLTGLEYEHRETGNYGGDYFGTPIIAWRANRTYETSSYGQLDYTQDKWRMLLGARYVNNNDAGDAWLPRMSLVYNFDFFHSIKLLYSVGFTSPSATAKYIQLNNVVGDEHLKAETISTLDLAYSYNHNNALFVANTFYFEADNFIGFKPQGIQVNAVNSPSFQRYGFELDYQKNMHNKQLLANFSYHHQGNEIIADDPIAITVPKYTVNLALHFKPYEQQTAGASVQLLSERNNDPAKDTLSPLWLLNAHYDVLFKQTEINVNIKNILDKDVRQGDMVAQFVGSVPVSGRTSLLVNLKYKF